MSLAGPLEVSTTSAPVGVAASLQDLMALYMVNDRVRYIMRLWNTHAGAKATEEQHQIVQTMVSRWMAEVASVRRRVGASTQPLRDDIIALRKVGFHIEKQFGISLAWLAPGTYAKQFAPLLYDRMKAMDIKAILQSLKELVGALVSMAWNPVRMITTGAVATGTVAVGVAKDVGKGLVITGERVLGTLDFFTKNLTFFALVAVGVYFLPQITGKIGSAKRSYGGTS